METTPAMDVALSGDRIPMAGLLRLDTIDHGPVMLLDGAGVLKWGGDIYSGRHPQFGSIGSMRAISDGIAEAAPSLRVSLLIPDESVDGIAWSTFQGFRFRLWIACYSMQTGLVVPDPYALFDGEVDIVTLRLGDRTLSVDIDCVSSFERLFEDDEWIRLNPSWLRTHFPDAGGLDQVTGVTNQVYWGQNAPKGNVTWG
jgi:hypothetical protein